MWPEGLALSQFNHTQLIYATKCACIVHIRISLVPTRLHIRDKTWLPCMHKYRYDMCAWSINITTRDWTAYVYEHTCLVSKWRDNTWLDYMYTWREYSVCTWLRWLHMYCIWPYVLDCIHAHFCTADNYLIWGTLKLTLCLHSVHISWPALFTAQEACSRLARPKLPQHRSLTVLRMLTVALRAWHYKRSVLQTLD